MITEKTIEKSRFFTTNGKDIWKVKTVDKITAVELTNCENDENEVCVIGEELAKRFHPVIMPKVKTAAAVTKKKKPGKKKTASNPASKSGRGVRAGKKESSQYLGVTVKIGKIRKKRFYAQSNRAGKYTGLGVHDVEELAAAAVQEHLGNEEEATRLRMLAKKKTGSMQIKAPAQKGSEEVEHKRIFAQESPDE